MYSCGPFRFKSRYVELVYHLLQIFKLSIQSGHLPSIWKKSLIPLFTNLILNH